MPKAEVNDQGGHIKQTNDCWIIWLLNYLTASLLCF